ncbi:MAG: hypothetical protein HY549_01440 [Elusimicrobia bacterium]|nr:hypothetical protein [Elusimicrobiota bacterium]
MRLAIRLLGAIKAATLFAVRRPKEAAIILLAAFLALTFWRLKRERGHAQELAAKLEGLPSDTKQVVTIYRNRVITKWRDGPTRVEYRDRYLPPEGKIEVVTKTDKHQNSPEIIIKDRGVTSRIGGGIVYAGAPLPLLDLKYAYWRRYSLTIGVTPRFGGAGMSRHIDDFTPFSNLELVGLLGTDWSGKSRFGLGLRTNF